MSGIWDISYLKGSNKWMGAVLNGWQVSPIVTLTSGSPISLLTGADKNCDGFTTDRPDYVVVASFAPDHREPAHFILSYPVGQASPTGRDEHDDK